MAITAWRAPRRTSFGTALSSQLVNGSGESAALVFRPPAGNLRKFAVRIGAIANAPDNAVRFSFQSVDANGLPDGTPDQSATIAGGSLAAAAWNDPGNFSADRTVNGVELVAAVIDYTSFVAGDDFAVVTWPGGSRFGSPPYAVLNGTISNVDIPSIAVYYDTGAVAFLDDAVFWPVTSFATQTVQLTTPAADEYALAFTHAVPRRIAGFDAFVDINAAGSIEALLYSGTTVLRTCTISDTDQLGSNSATYHRFLFDDGEYDLAANTQYRLSLRVTAGSINLITCGFDSQAIVDGALENGNSSFLSTRVDLGAWNNDYNASSPGFRRVPYFPIVTGIDNGASAGTTIAGSAMLRGMVA